MRDILVSRRQAHLRTLPGLTLFAGIPREPGSENIWIMNGLRIFQEPALMHLTGINQPGVFLALDPKGKEREILFLPPKDPRKEFWDGVRLGYPIAEENTQSHPSESDDLADARALTGILDIRPSGEFEAWFLSRVAKEKSRRVYAFFHDYADPKKKEGRLTSVHDHNYAFKKRLEKLAATAAKGFEIKSCAAEHLALRLPLDKPQIQDVLKANRLTGQAFAETLGQLSRFRNENEVAAHLEWGMKRASPFGLSFPSIVASGRNATILHYLKNDQPLDAKGMLLLDFGVRWGTMHADVTRTIPVNGKFNPLQELLYRIVLEANELVHRACRPGVTIRELNRSVWDYIEKQLAERFTRRGGKMVRGYEGQPHGVSHLMGEQEHDGDPHRLYQDHPLQPGWQISNEPGLYGHFAITLDGKRFAEWIGIRIEDDILVTSRGSRNLSAMIPKTPPEIERLIA